MNEQCQELLRCDPQDLRQAISVHTGKITDSCRDKDCIEDLRVYLTRGSQAVLDTCASAKVRSAELLYAYIDVEPVSFDRNHYCVDVTFYYRVLADALVGATRPATLYGLAVFSKRAVLCGEESKAHIFTSQTRLNELDGLSLRSANLPRAVVEVLDPMILSSKVRQSCDCTCQDPPCQIPGGVQGLFDEELVISGEQRKLYVTLGQFSIIRLERDAQIVVPVLQYSIPTKECCETPGCGEDPCEMFSRIPFPEKQFTPTGCDGQNDCACGYKTANG